ncbi:MAG TPA: aerotolerance regulator BatA [Ignavibacteriales bacterium]|nr:aerotolerance regulator BatA [Ignavibacteriales bacterium]
MSFAYPWILYFLLVIPILAAWYIWQGRKKLAAITYSSLRMFNKIPVTLRERLRHLPFVLRMLALLFLIIALARPQNFSAGQSVNSEGIDIAMVLDISGSMLAEDFKPNRLEAAKEVIDKFVSARTTDRIGLVIFSREAFTQCPLTIDYSVLRNLLGGIKTGMIEDGTAIGNGIANGVNRLKDSNAESKVIILLTDGVNNAGEVDPVSAAEIASTFGIRIYTIGVGTRGEAPYPVQTPFGTRYQMVPVEIDEAILKKIAEITGGEYFRATNNKALEEIYNKIDKMEKTKIEITSYRNAKELFAGYLEIGFLLLILELLASKTILRKLP